MKLLDFDTRKETTVGNFGIVEVGTTKLIKIIMKNDTPAEINTIKVFVDNSEVKVESYPETMKPNSEELLVLSYTPNVDIKRGLKTLINISGLRVYKD